MDRCTPRRRKECASRSGPHLEFMCSQCEARDGREPGAWFGHIRFLYLLQMAGYPFKQDDLNIEEWLDMGVLREEMENMRRG